MKTLDLIHVYSTRALVFACCIVAVLFIDTNNNVAMSEESTKEETIDYIERKLKHYFGHSCDNYLTDGTPTGLRLSWSLKEFSISNDGTMEAITTYLTTGKTMQTGSTNKSVVHVSDLNPNAVKVKQDRFPSCKGGDYISVELNCIEGTCVKENRTFDAGGINKGWANYVSFEFDTHNSAEAERVAKAFRHLIKLYGGKGSKELFD